MLQLSRGEGADAWKHHICRSYTALLFVCTPQITRAERMMLAKRYLAPFQVRVRGCGFERRH